MTIAMVLGMGSGRGGDQRGNRGVNSFFILLSPPFLCKLEDKTYVLKKFCILTLELLPV